MKKDVGLHIFNSPDIPFPNSYCLSNPIAYRGTVIWSVKLLSTLASDRDMNAFTKKPWPSYTTWTVKLSSVESPSSMQHMDTDVVYF